MFGRLEVYRDRHGNCDVPFHHAGGKPSLGYWVAGQRQRRRLNRLSPARIRLLEGIGFSWSKHAQAWDEMIAAFGAFQKTHGHGDVPLHYALSPNLGPWVRVQRTNRRAGRISRARVRQLDRLGFLWRVPRGQRWETMFAALRNFQREYGHCNVPGHDLANPHLNAWINDQRLALRLDKLSAERVRRLTALGLSMNPLESRRDELFTLLGAFKKKNGHCNVPARHAAHPKLGHWVHNQRNFFRRGKLPPDIVIRLTALGFDWEPGAAPPERSDCKT